MALDLYANPFSNLNRLIDASLWQDHDELVAAVTNNTIGVTHRRQDDGGDFHQHVRARKVSVQIVDSLEVIQVQEESCQFRVVTARALGFIYQKLAQIACVVQ